MNTPRCGVRDNIGHGGAARKKRYALQGSKWRKNVLTYKITKYPRHRLQDRGQVDREIEKAFQAWNQVANIRFVRQDHGPIDIEIRWEEGDHNCAGRFDGPGSTLAHAFFPERGDAHFDDAEKWTIGAYGDYYWEIRKEKKNKIAPGYPRRISGDWGGLPGNIDAAVTWPNGNTYIFKRHQYWRFKNRNMDPGYPKDISQGFAGVPNDIDAAVVWSGNGKTYFFKGSQYWKYDRQKKPRISSKYPRSISRWPGVPTDLTAAFQWVNKKTYFFKGNQYYKFNDQGFNVEQARPGYPRSVSRWWLDC